MTDDNEIKLTREQRFIVAGWFTLGGLYGITTVADIMLGRWLAILDGLLCVVFIWSGIWAVGEYRADALRRRWYQFVMHAMTARNKQDLN